MKECHVDVDGGWGTWHACSATESNESPSTRVDLASMYVSSAAAPSVGERSAREMKKRSTCMSGVRVGEGGGRQRAFARHHHHDNNAHLMQCPDAMGRRYGHLARRRWRALVGCLGRRALGDRRILGSQILRLEVGAVHHNNVVGRRVGRRARADR